jgi:hypothetical protein
VLVIHQKLTSPKGLLREVSIWRKPKSARYPEGVRYRLVLVEPRTGNVLLLFDNHWPKGHHVHVGQREENFEFRSIPDLIQEFRERSEQEEKKYHESKKD